MNATELKDFRSFLLEQKGSILNRNNEFRTEQLVAREHVSEEAEAASLDLSNNLSIHLHERDRSVLLQIEKALSKIETQTYGQCESCGEMIETKRLRARPFADLCIACKEEQEDPRSTLN